MIIGYARVSKEDSQDNTTQINLLKSNGAEIIYEESVSGGKYERPQLHKMLDALKPSDTVLVYKLDRLSRSLKDTLIILDRIESHKALFKSLTENIETITPQGKMMMQILGSFSEFERAMIRERTKAGLKTLKDAGKLYHRPRILSEEKRLEIRTRILSGEITTVKASEIYKMAQSTMSRIKHDVTKKAI